MAEHKFVPDHPQFMFHKTQSQTPLPLLSLHVSQNKGRSDRSTTLNRRLMGKHTTKQQEWKGRPRSAGRASHRPPALPAASAHLCAPYLSNSSWLPTPTTSHDPHRSSPCTPGPIPGPGPAAAPLQPRSPIPPCPSAGPAPAAEPPPLGTSHASSPRTLVLRAAPRGCSPSPRPSRCAHRPGSPSAAHSAPAPGPAALHPV